MRVLALFAVDGIGRYRETFGAQAGEAMLARLPAVQRRGRAGSRAYRLEDDRFALAGRVTGATASAARAGLTDRGPGFALVGVHAGDTDHRSGMLPTRSPDALVRGGS
jgi:hypothetical protein